MIGRGRLLVAAAMVLTAAAAGASGAVAAGGPLQPPMPVTLTETTTKPVAYTGSPGLTALLPETGGVGAVGELEVAYPPSAVFRTVQIGVANAVGEIPFGPGSPWLPQWSGLQRNARVRVELTGCAGVNDGNPGDCLDQYQPSYSNVVPVEVLPEVHFTVGPVGRHRYGEWVELYTSNVSRAYRGPIMYLYVRRHGRFQLLGHARMVAKEGGDGGTPVRTPVAGVPVPSPSVWEQSLLACVRTRVLSYMGAPFEFPSCGARTLAHAGPAGSTWQTF
jgi:hypothetical protein